MLSLNSGSALCPKYGAPYRLFENTYKILYIRSEKERRHKLKMPKRPLVLHLSLLPCKDVPGLPLYPLLWLHWVWRRFRSAMEPRGPTVRGTTNVRGTNRIDAAVQTVCAPDGWALAVEHRRPHRYIKGAEASVSRARPKHARRKRLCF